MVKVKNTESVEPEDTRQWYDGYNETELDDIWEKNKDFSEFVSRDDSFCSPLEYHEMFIRMDKYIGEKISNGDTEINSSFYKGRIITKDNGDVILESSFVVNENTEKELDKVRKRIASKIAKK